VRRRRRIGCAAPVGLTAPMEASNLGSPSRLRCRTNIEQNRSLSTNCLFFSKRETRRRFRGNLRGVAMDDGGKTDWKDEF
jgi:hypothetical protein